MKASARLAPAMSRRQALAVVAVSTLVALPHTLFQPLTIGAACTMLLLWRGLLAWRETPLPPRALVVLLAFVAVAIVWFSFNQLLGKQPGLAVLMMFLPLKLLEARSPRDGRAALLLACFLTCGLFVHEQGILTATFGMAGALGIITVFSLLQRDRPLRRGSLRGTLTLVAQGVPLLVVLFIFFPRVDGPLWGMPLDAYSGLTGLSDRMSPGSISNLITNGEIAFRAEFQGTPPPPPQRYWRGPVLMRFDGREWSQILSAPEPRPSYEPAGPAYEYAITMEPHNQRWLLALDYPAEAGSIGRHTADYSLISLRPVRTRQRYTLRSHPQTPAGQEISRYARLVTTALPRDSNPRTVALGREWLMQGGSDQERLNRVVTFMRRAGLIYTLTPPLTGLHSADDFLFETRQGFCEHFSAAFVILARAAGLPARVVTGYQGGELNPVDGTIVVRQSDAHAWAEVWLETQGWVRVDPTAASYPSRLESGLGNTLGSDALPFVLRTDLQWLRDLRYRWEALSNTWNQWVLGYNARRQAELMQQLGLPDGNYRTLVGLLVGCASVWILWLLWRMRPRARKTDALDAAWQALCRKLARRGLARQHWESPSDYARRIVTHAPALAPLSDAAERYAQARYGPRPATPEDVAALRDVAKALDEIPR